jgi:hypothetical protein
MRTFLKAVVLLLICAGAAGAQTLSPIISECGAKCKGEFTVTNNGLAPMAVTIQPVSFSLDKDTGRSIFRPLDSTVTIRLAESSARVPIKGAHTFSYDLQCNAAPCPVTFLVSMSAGHTDSGLQIKIEIPAVVYSCERAKDCRANVRKAAGL